MSELPSHVEQSISARRLFVRGQRIVVAVSGGLDSMVLLHVLRALASRHGWHLVVAHLNHQLRGSSSNADERLVRRTGERLRLAVRVERAEVRRSAETHHLSLEMAARKARHEFLARTAAQLKAPSIALAHHADDQIELFFLRLFRGSGGDGLAGMKWRILSPANRNIELVRPLLDQPKSALLNYATETGIRFREDASNACLDIQRNRIRHELLPLLRAKYQPALDDIILRTADIVGTEAEFVARTARDWLRRRLIERSSKRLVRLAGESGPRGDPNSMKGLRRTMPFEQLSLALQRRVVQVQLLSRGITADFRTIEQLRSAANRAVCIRLGQPDSEGCGKREGLTVRRARGRCGDGSGEDGEGVELRLQFTATRDALGIVHLQAPPEEAFRPDSMPVVLTERAGEICFAGARISWQVDSRPGFRRPRNLDRCEFFDADRVGSHILLRHWRPGDRFQPIGMANPVKLQDFFTNQKVPPGLRRRLTLAATAEGEVFWVEGMRISERFKLSNQTIHRLQWCWERP